MASFVYSKTAQAVFGRCAWRYRGASACLYLVPLMLCLGLGAVSQSVNALEAISIGTDTLIRIDVTKHAEHLDNSGDRLQIETAPDKGGILRRMEVRAVKSGSNPSWLVFALRNETDLPVFRLLTVNDYDVVGSGVLWPDLVIPRIKNVTPSVGFLPERIEYEGASVFELKIEPGQTVTYVVELATPTFHRLWLWQRDAFERASRDNLVVSGPFIGISALLGVALTLLAATRRSIVVLGSAFFSWAVMARLGLEASAWVQLGFVASKDVSAYVAGTEALAASGLAMLLGGGRQQNANSRSLTDAVMLLWIGALVACIAVAAIEPRMGATLARLSFPLIILIGLSTALYRAIMVNRRALWLVAGWVVCGVWTFAAATIFSGRLGGEITAQGGGNSAVFWVFGAGLVALAMVIGLISLAMRAGQQLNDLEQHNLAIPAPVASGGPVKAWTDQAGPVVRWLAKRKPTPQQLFISYRRDDSRDVTGRIYDRLIRRFGSSHVFKDVDSIPFGTDFRAHIDDTIRQCNTMLVIIGRDWLSAGSSSGEPRLNDPMDFVRVEIEAALAFGIRVIPVLVGGANMPSLAELPTAINKLAFLNAVQVRPDPDFHRDMDRFILGLAG